MTVDEDALAVVYEKMVTEPRTFVLVAEDSTTNAALGVLIATLVLSVKFAGPSFWIEELYVAKRARRRGLGRSLVEALLDLAAGLGVRGIDLEAYQGNAPAAVLYRSLGFRRIGRQRFHYKLEWENETDD